MKIKKTEILYYVIFLVILIPTKDGSYIFYAPIIHVDGAFYVIGGRTGHEIYSKTIARLDSISYEWSKPGDLIKGRRGHNAIFDGSDIIIVGGYDGRYSLTTEKCTISGDKVTCVEQDPALQDYSYYPELFLVEEGYCKELSSL